MCSQRLGNINWNVHASAPQCKSSKSTEFLSIIVRLTYTSAELPKLLIVGLIMPSTLFAAYPAEPPEIGQTLQATEQLPTDSVSLLTWQKAFGPGRFIDANVLPEIDKSDGLLFELSTPNNNVFFEAGYAIGIGKAVVPVCNSSLAQSGQYLKKLGLFDNVGYQSYENSQGLRTFLDGLILPQPLFTSAADTNQEQAVYVLDALRRSEFASKVISAVKSSIKFFRSFDPQEEYRLSLRTAWEQVSASTGVLVTLLSDTKEDAQLHNLRASFLAGLATGLNRCCLILVDGNARKPLDFIDDCRTIRHPDDISAHVNEFGTKSLSLLQRSQKKPSEKKKNLLQRVSVGSTAAENEYRHLEDYYVDTAAYRSALDGRGRIVIGRKGSGKTAIFWRVRDVTRSDGQNVIVDLKPDGYQLRKFKEQLVNHLTAGTKEHTLTAFWGYLLLGEVVNKIFETDYRKFYGKDPRLTEALDRLRPHRDSFMEDLEGDFSERMMLLLDRISTEFKTKHGEQSGKFLTTGEVTDLIYRSDIRKVEHDTLEYLKLRGRTIVLLDNIDKGWGAHGVDSDDVTIVTALIDALRKLERQASRNQVEFDWLLFLRNDVYELLIDQQSDRGKEDTIFVDWESPSALRSVVDRRISVSTSDKSNNAGVQWESFAVNLVDGQRSMDWLIDRSLMKPRYLIQLVRECIGHAVTAGKSEIELEDLREGYRLYSLDVIGNTNFELRDVNPNSFDSIYALIGSQRRTTIGEVHGKLRSEGYEKEDIGEIVRLFFWYGILGASTANGEERYIFDYRYDEKIFFRFRQTQLLQSEPVYINLAFSRGLDCVELV